MSTCLIFLFVPQRRSEITVVMKQSAATSNKIVNVTVSAFRDAKNRSKNIACCCVQTLSIYFIIRTLFILNENVICFCIQVKCSYICLSLLIIITHIFWCYFKSQVDGNILFSLLLGLFMYLLFL